MTQPIKSYPISEKENLGQVSPSKQMRKLKVQLSDKIFELRKIEEDYAQEKALLMIQFNEQKQCLAGCIKNLRQKLIEENEHWSMKIDELRNQHLGVLKGNNEQWLSQIDELVNNKLKANKQMYEQKIKELECMQLQLEQTLSGKQKQHAKVICELKQRHKNVVKSLKLENQQQIQSLKIKMNAEQNIRISAVMHIKNIQQKQHSLAKKIYADKEMEFQNSITLAERKVIQMNEQIQGLKIQVQRLQSQSKNQTEKILILEEVKKEIQNISNKESQQKISKLEQQWKISIEKVNENWKNQLRKVQQIYEKMSTAYIQKQKLWEQRARKMIHLCGKRESKDQDVRMIEQLEVRLIRKDFELQKQRQQVKFCKLEIDNMDDIYKRIFHSGPKKNRNSFMQRKMKLPILINRSTQPLKGPDSS